MSRYIPVRTTMDSEDHYHSPYDTHDIDSDAHYEAPTCLKRNPSGSLFIPSGDYKSQIILIYVVSSRACHGIFLNGKLFHEPQLERASIINRNLVTWPVDYWGFYLSQKVEVLQTNLKINWDNIEP